MPFDAKKYSTKDWVVIGAAAVAFISIFLPWYGFSGGGFSASVNGWSTSYGWLGALIIIAGGVYLFIHRYGADLSKVKMGPGVIVLATSILGTLIVVIRWINLPSSSGSLGFGATYSYGPQIGIYLTIICGIAAGVGAFMLFRQSGEKLPWADSGTTGGSVAPPPAAPPAPPTPPPTPPSDPPAPPTA